MNIRRWVLLLALFAVPLGSAQQQATPATSTQVTLEGGRQEPETIWTNLMEGNKRFAAGKTELHEVVQTRHRLANGQHPKVIVLACSDSRVAPELLFDMNLGELFVIRSAGNIADSIGLGSMEYAVEHLGSSVLVVLGHEKCGAVTAACSGDKMPSPNLQAIVDKIGPAVTVAKNHAGSGELVASAIRENVHQSARSLLANSEILRDAMKDGRLTIFEAVYKLDSGEVVRLESPSSLADGRGRSVDVAIRLH